MPLFQFKAIDAKGKVTKGSSPAGTLGDLKAILKTQGLFLMEGKETEAGEEKGSPKASGKLDAGRYATSNDKAPLKGVLVFTTQLSIMVRTALPILEAISGLARQQSDPVFKSILIEICKDVQHGRALSQAFSRFPKVFDDVYISLLAAGEASGNLDVMLDRIAGYLNFRKELKAKVHSSLLYPSIVVGVSVAVVAFLVLFVLPTFMEVFNQFEIQLPLSTRVLIAVSDHVRAWWAPYLGVLVFGGWYFRRWFSDPAKVGTLHVLQLHVPLIGPLARTIVMTRIMRTLASLVAGGVPILKSLDLARASAGNVVFSEILDEVYKNARAGKGLSLAFSNSPYVPPQVADMIANSEKTGTLPEVLTKLADYYEKETDASIKNLFSVLEPLFVVALGVLVGGIAVAILLPIFQLDAGL